MDNQYDNCQVIWTNCGAAYEYFFRTIVSYFLSKTGAAFLVKFKHQIILIRVTTGKQ